MQCVTEGFEIGRTRLKEYREEGMQYVIKGFDIGRTRYEKYREDSPCRFDCKEDTPTIFIPIQPGIPGAYFNGPWLPMGYQNQCTEYAFSLDYPLQILEIDDRRRRLIDTLDRLKGRRQGFLFAPGSEQIESCLDDILALHRQGRQLYKRWSQNVNGKVRDLSVPADPLKIFLKEHVKDIIMQLPCHQQSHGGEKGWSVEASLKTHMPFSRVLAFDMADAFKRVDIQYVFDVFYRNFLEKIEDDEARKDVAGFLTTVCTVYYKDMDLCALSQGSPISMALFNRIMYPVDKLFHKGARKRGLKYSRWVDDMIISSKKNTKMSKFCGALSIMREDFAIKAEKVFFQTGPKFHLLGYEINCPRIRRVGKDEEINRGDLVDPLGYANKRESEHWWAFDDCEEDDYPILLDKDGSRIFSEDEGMDMPF